MTPEQRSWRLYPMRLKAWTDRWRCSRWSILSVPNTDSVDGCLRIKAAIESSSRLTVSGWIGNTNLIEETTAGHISFGAEFMASLSEASGLAVKFVTAPQGLLAEARTMHLPWPVLPVQRQLVPPWTRAVNMQAGLTMDHKE